MRNHRLLLIPFCVAFFWLQPDAAGKELEYPKPCYTDQELAAVRAWEKEWAGRKIDSRTVASVREFLPESFFALMIRTAQWGESFFVIVPYRQILPTPGTVSFTTKYYKRARTDARTGEILDYTAGVPFPDTTEALEMAHNFRCRNYGDTVQSSESGYIVDGRLRYDMNVEIYNNMSFFSGRTDMPPVPELPRNPKGLWRAFSMLQKQPPEARNIRILELHYKDRLQAYDSWMWYPVIRRVRRRSTAERQDALGGADFCAFDNFGWDGPVSLNRYRYLGSREFLLCRHNDPKRLTHAPGDCLWNGTQRERVKAHVIEAVSRDPNFMYGKMVWYLDPETWQILYSDRYDRGGTLWKVLDQIGFVTRGYGGTEVNYFCANQMIDVQRTHATLASAEYEFGVDLPESMFTVDFLQKHGY